MIQNEVQQIRNGELDQTLISQHVSNPPIPSSTRSSRTNKRNRESFEVLSSFYSSLLLFDLIIIIIVCTSLSLKIMLIVNVDCINSNISLRTQFSFLFFAIHSIFFHSHPYHPSPTFFFQSLLSYHFSTW